MYFSVLHNARVGHEDAECMRRSGECLVLEATELLKVSFITFNNYIDFIFDYSH